MLQPPRWSDVVRDSELAELRQLPHESVALRGWGIYEVVRQPLHEDVAVRDWEIYEVPPPLHEDVVVRDWGIYEVVRQPLHEDVVVRGWRIYEVVRQPLHENVVVRDWEIDEVPLALRESVFAHACPQPVELKVSRSVQDR